MVDLILADYQQGTFNYFHDFSSYYLLFFLNRFIKSLNATNFNTCLPIDYKSFINQNNNNESFEICHHDNYLDLWVKIHRRLINETRKTLKPCMIHQYDGDLMTFYEHMPNYRHIQVAYIFKSDEMIVRQEYLIIDDIQLIGTVGGTLGLFIGFSFLDVLQKCMTKFKIYLLSKLSQ